MKINMVLIMLCFTAMQGALLIHLHKPKESIRPIEIVIPNTVPNIEIRDLDLIIKREARSV